MKRSYATKAITEGMDQIRPGRKRDVEEPATAITEGMDQVRMEVAALSQSLTVARAEAAELRGIVASLARTVEALVERLDRV